MVSRLALVAALAAAAFAAAAAAVAGCSTTAATGVAARVPHAAPALAPGHAQPASVEATVGATSVAHLGDVTAGAPGATVDVPGTQLHGGARLALGDALAVGAFYEHGVAATGQAVDPDVPSVDGAVHGAGVLLHGALQTKHRDLRIGVQFDVSGWRLPYVAYEPCVAPCEGEPPTVVTRGHVVAAAFGLGLAPSYDLGRVTVFAGLTARTHPTVDDAAVAGGVFNWIVHAGAEVALPAALRAALIVYYPTTPDPVRYPPGAAVTLTVPLAR
jgi:hypothetical protein